MRYIVQITAAFVFWAASLGAALAQEDDKGFLTRTIQNALSGSGRTVSIDGFQGALSSTASFDQMTIADGQGIWLTLDDVVLDWNRSALLRGRLEVEKLTAGRLDIPRLPVSEGVDLPDAEATPFSLPELPVSIDIADFGVDQINLGADLLGEAAQLNVQATAQYTDDLIDLDVSANRTDAKRGEFEIKVNLERSDNILDLIVRLSEGEEGLVGKLLSLPGQPSVDMTVNGSGPLDAFASDLNISTDGQERLAGQITVGTQEARSGSDAADRRIQADIGGDISALLAPQFREFFGENVQLTLDAVVKGAFLCTKAVIPTMITQQSGRIVNIASRAHHGNPGQANYSAAKAGLIGFTGSQAREQGRFNITVNCVAPGFVATPLVQALPHFEKIKEKTIANTPIPRLGCEEDIANAVLFLVSERASFITGETVHVTGGRYSN